MSSNINDILKEILSFQDDPTLHEGSKARHFRSMLSSTDWLMVRHQEELIEGSGTTLNDDELDKLLTNRKHIRSKVSELHAILRKDK